MGFIIVTMLGRVFLLLMPLSCSLYVIMVVSHLMFSCAFGHWHTNMAKLILPILCPNPTTPMHGLYYPMACKKANKWWKPWLGTRQVLDFLLSAWSLLKPLHHRFYMSCTIRTCIIWKYIFMVVECCFCRIIY